MTDFADQIANFSPKRLALLANELHDELEALQQARTEPLAIVGIGCRFPGGADGPAAYWRLLRDGGDAVGEVPADRWDVDAYYDPDPEAAGKMTTRYGAFLQQVDQFDPEFFGIAPREARRMDPQQRLLLEVAWEALENAALPPDRLAGTATGVFMGVSGTDYSRWQFASPKQLDAYAGSGIAHSVVANRLSYLLDFHGPSLAVDTACSSSLVAVHLACQSLRARECDLALAGGVNLILSPEASIIFSRARMLAPDGRCKTFDARADGYVRGEGCGVIVLKRLADALRAGDVIQAVIRGSAVNQDGKSNGLTAPNLLAQQAVLRAALAQAQVPPETVGYLEAHGTGTALGDPIEVEALAAVYGQPRADGAPAWLGSVKTNLGHLEAAAGIAGLLKAVLALQQGAVPPHLHFQSLNPSIRLSGTPLTIPTALTPWPADGQPRRAGVSAFGFGGTNAHLILEEAPTLPMPDRAEVAGSQLLTLSAHHPAALQALAERYEDYLGAPAAASWPDVAATSHQGRSHLGERLAVAAADKAEAIERLTQWRTTGSARGVQAGRASAAPKVAFLFPGQGVSLAGVGLGWYAHAPVFRAALDQCAELLAGELKTDLKTGLWAAPGTELAALREQTAFIQPALVALGWALAEQFKAWGVIPAAVLGHSIGEYGAAVVAGRLSLAEGLRLAAARGRGMQALPAGGAMLSVEADEQWVADLLRQVNSQAVIAAVNAPRRVVVAGTAEQVAAAEAACAAAGVSVRRLSVGHAFHSPLMAPMLPGFGAALPSAAAQPTDSGITFVSGQWGRVAAQRDQLGPAYWRDQILAPVRYAAGVAALAALGCDVLIELGPGGQLSGLGQLSWEATGQPEPMWVRPLRGQGDEWTGVLESVGRLYTTGLALDWAALDGPTPHRSSLPTYPFQRQRYWVEVAPALSNALDDGALPGRRLETAMDGAVYEHTISVRGQPFLDDHQLNGQRVVPGAYYVALALAAARRSGHGSAQLTEILFEQLLTLDATEARTLQVIVTPEGSSAQLVEIFSRGAGDETWTRHARAALRVEALSSEPSGEQLDQLQARCAEPVDVAAFYEQIGEAGLALGPSLRWLGQLWRGEGEALAQIVPPSDLADRDWREHPGLVDAGLQVAGALLPLDARTVALYLPVGIDAVQDEGGAWSTVVFIHARQRPAPAGSEARSADVALLDADGRVLWRLLGVTLARAAQPMAAAVPPASLTGLRWEPLSLAAAEPAPVGRWWLVAAADDPVVRALSTALVAAGQQAEILNCEQASAQLRSAADASIVGLVLLTGLDRAAPDADSVAELVPLALLQALLAQTHPPRLWLLSVGAQAAGPLAPTPQPLQALRAGLALSLAHEHLALRATLLDLDPALPLSAQANALTQRLLAGDDPHAEPRQSLRGLSWLAPRLVPLDATPDGPQQLQRPASGSLDDMTLVPLMRQAPGPGQVEIAVHAAGLNFRDALNALGELPGGGPLGGECAGRIVAVGEGVTGLAVGQRVLALAPGSLATHVTVPAALVAPLPAELDWASAAALPIAHLTARLALREVAGLGPGQAVLIHSAAGGVGLAAVQLARALGATVVASAGSAAKRALLSGLGIQAIADSRDPGTYAAAVAQATGGRGVDVVVNALSGDAIAAGLDVLAPGGLFIELGKRGIWSAADIAARRPDVRYAVIDLLALTQAEPERVGGWLRELLSDIAAETLQPLPVRTFGLADAAKALRTLAAGQPVGKLVLVPAQPPSGELVRSDGTYLITGGRGALGLAAAAWLVASGARHLALLSRGAPDPDQSEAIERLRAAGANILVLAADLADPDPLASALQRLRDQLPPLRGVLHAAGVVADGLLARQGVAELAQVLQPKVNGLWALDAALADTDLDWWINCSSAVALFGQTGQAAYAAANAGLDAWAAQQRALGRPALSLNFGPISGAGMAARAGERVAAGWATVGVRPLPLAAVGPTLAAAWAQGHAQLAALAWTKRANATATTPVPAIVSRLPEWQPAQAIPEPIRQTGAQTESSLIAALQAALPMQRQTVLVAALQVAAGDILGLAAGQRIDPQRPLSELGLDSLLSVELRNRLARLLGRPLPATLLFDYPTLAGLTAHLLTDVLDFAPATPPTLRPPAAATSPTEPIAIIGVGCRFPGGADSPEAFWQLLRDGVDAIREVPADRWDVNAYFDADPEAPSKMNTRWGAFLDDIDRFDATFFGIAPREAMAMDPQQRLLLEVAWEALERAGLAPPQLGGSQTGVFVGISTADYAQRQQRHADLDRVDAYTGTGSSLSVAAGRLSYVLGLQGPSMAIDTACSSALVALHLACQSLRAGECTLALAGGVNIILNPEGTVYFSKLRAMAADGRCKTFDARADGYVRSEGCGVVVLKRLSEAERDGDPIWAVVRGSAVNQDGRSNGLTAPNGPAQEAVIRAALERAGLAPARVSYVEAHGTGTALGDPIEVQALAAVLSTDRTNDQPLWVGSVKTNLGHLEAAAGMAGLIKTVLALQQRALPPHLHFQTPSPHIPWADIPVTIPTALMEWPAPTGPRVAGVSSFGISGTNAHVVVEEAPALAAPELRGGPHLLPLSARSPAALQALAARYAAMLSAPNAPQLADVAAAARLGRSHLAHRTAIVAETSSEAHAAMRALAEARSHPALQTGYVAAGVPEPRVVFVCAGQGGQWAAMAQATLADPLAAQTLERVAQAAPPDLGWSLLPVLADPAAPWLDRIDQLQPILFALQIALAERLAAEGIEPAAMVGHSFGEVAAAYLAGVLSLPDALRVICARSRALAQRRGQGTMAVVELTPDEALAAMREWADTVTLAGVNGPRSVILSGDATALADLVNTLQTRGTFARLLAVDVAAHSPQLDALLPGLQAELSVVQSQASRLPLYSTVTGQRTDGLALEAAYWARNLRAPVQFWPAIQALVADGYTHFLELSPHPTHVAALSDGLHALQVPGAALPTLRRDRPVAESLLSTVGALYCAGVVVDWRPGTLNRQAVTVLPTYPFQRERYWIDLTPSAPAPQPPRPPTNDRAGRNFLGQRVDLSLPGELSVWQQDLALESFDYLTDHRLDGTVVVPGTAYVDWMLAAAREALGTGPHQLEEVRFEQMLALPEKGSRRVQVVWQPGEPGQASVRLFSRLTPADGAEEGPPRWTLHAAGTIRNADGVAAIAEHPRVRLDDIRARCPQHLAAADFYAALAEQGLAYGPRFQGVAEIYHGQGEAVARLANREAAGSTAHLIPPALLDACFQILGATLPLAADVAAPYLPVGLSRLQLLRAPVEAHWVHVRRLEAAAGGEVTGDVTLYAADGQPVLQVDRLTARRVPLQPRAAAGEIERLFHRIIWIAAPVAPAAPATGPGHWIIFADRAGQGAALRAQLEASGQRCVTILAGEPSEPRQPDVYHLDPEDPAAFRRLLREAISGAGKCRGIIHLWSLDAADEPAAAGDLACTSALHLVQALSQAGWRDQPRLWLVTRGAQAVSAEQRTIHATQAPLWGFGRTIALEQPALRCTLVDLDPDSSAGADASLGALCLADGAEDALAWRAGQAYVPRLVRAELADTTPAVIRADGTYLITGGLGGLGLTVARWLVSQGARYLALAGRNDPPPAAMALLSELRGAGATVVTVRADVSQRADVARLLEQIAHELPPLCGVLHAAGSLDDSVITQLSAPRLRAVMAPKVDGAWHLHELTQGSPLDCFVLFSSAAALLGSPGQANYAAANAYLDALAQQRRAAGLAALSVNWGPWAEVGLAAAQANRGQRLAVQGMSSLTPRQGLRALALLMGQPAAQVAALSLNLRQWREFHLAAADAPLLSELLRAEADQLPLAADSAQVIDALRAAEAAARQPLLAAHLREQVAQVMRLDPAAIDPLTPLGSLGLDSLMGLEIRNRLERSLGLTLSAALIWTYPTLTALADYLAGALELTPARDMAPNGHSAKRAAEDTARAAVAELSDEEAERALLEALDGLAEHKNGDGP